MSCTETITLYQGGVFLPPQGHLTHPKKGVFWDVVGRSKRCCWASDSTALGKEAPSCNVYMVMTLSPDLESVGWAEGAFILSLPMLSWSQTVSDLLWRWVVHRRSDEVPRQPRRVEKRQVP